MVIARNVADFADTGVDVIDPGDNEHVAAFCCETHPQLRFTRRLR